MTNILSTTTPGTPATPTRIGVVACSFPGAALCIQSLCAESERLLGAHEHPEISLNMLSFADHVRHVSQGRWDLLGDMLLFSAQRLKASGAELLICPDNTAHCAFDLIAAGLPLPWLHIAEPVAEEARRLGHRKLGLLGTRHTVHGPVYSPFMARNGLELVRPDETDLEALEMVIFSELSRGVVTDTARRLFAKLCTAFAQTGCDAVILGCTELPLLCAEDATGSLPNLDSTRLLAIAAARRAGQTTEATR